MVHRVKETRSRRRDGSGRCSHVRAARVSSAACAGRGGRELVGGAARPVPDVLPAPQLNGTAPATEQSHRAQPNGPPCRNRTAPLGGPAQQGNVSVRESADVLLRATAQSDRRGSTAGSAGSRARSTRIGRGGLPRVDSRPNDNRSGSRGMECVGCGAVDVTERPERTARGHRRFRCGDCGRQFDERNAGLLNRAQYPSGGHRRANVRWSLPATGVWPLPCAQAGGGLP